MIIAVSLFIGIAGYIVIEHMQLLDESARCELQYTCRYFL